MRPGAEPVKYEEDSSTRRSVANAKAMLVDRGVPDTVRLWYHPRLWYRVEAEWKKPHFRHEFEGFSWGYTGEGPHGLQVFLQAIGVPVTITKSISNWTPMFGGAQPVDRKGPHEWSPRNEAGIKVFRKDIDYGKDWI